MNEKVAKQIRRRALNLLLATGITGGEGYNEYKREKNRKDWEPVVTPDGKMMRGPDGKPFMRPVKVPGTIHCQWKLRLFTKYLKKLYKKGDANAKTIVHGSEEELVAYIDRAKEHSKQTNGV